MNGILGLDDLWVFLFSILLFLSLPYRWWLFPALLLTPDLSMIAYAFGPLAGAITYDVVHHRAISFGLYLAGFAVRVPMVSLVGVVLLAHAIMDRALGYGLKYTDCISHTHLGWIGGRQTDRDRFAR